MNKPLSHNYGRRRRCRATAAFELMAVVSISGLVSTALIPLLGSSAEIDRLQRTWYRSKVDSYLLEMEAASLGLNTDYLPKEFAVAEEDES